MQARLAARCRRGPGPARSQTATCGCTTRRCRARWQLQAAQRPSSGVFLAAAAAQTPAAAPSPLAARPRRRRTHGGWTAPPPTAAASPSWGPAAAASGDGSSTACRRCPPLRGLLQEAASLLAGQWRPTAVAVAALTTRAQASRAPWCSPRPMARCRSCAPTSWAGFRACWSGSAAPSGGLGASAGFDNAWQAGGPLILYGARPRMTQVAHGKRHGPLTWVAYRRASGWCGLPALQLRGCACAALQLLGRPGGLPGLRAQGRVRRRAAAGGRGAGL